MDFAWVVDALRRGLKVTREAWRGDQPMYLYMVTEKKPDGKRIIKMHPGTGPDFEWTPTASSTIEQLLIVDDWEEYVEPKKAAPAKAMQEDLPVWPEVNADGYARASKDSNVILHDGVYRFKKEPVFGNTKLTFDGNGQPHMGDTMTVEEYQKVHSGEKHIFKDLCDDYLEQQKGTCYIGKSVMPGRKELHGGEPVCESWPAVTKVWTTYWDLDIQITGALIDKADYPYTLCERDVIEQKCNKLVVLAEPGFSQRTVTLHLNENCWMDAKDASASLIHRLTNRFGWNTEFFISLLNGIEYTDGDWCKPCYEGDNRSLGDLFTEDMEFLAQEQARVAHSFYYIINQYLRLVQTTAPERQRKALLAAVEDQMEHKRNVLSALGIKVPAPQKTDVPLSKEDTNHV